MTAAKQLAALGNGPAFSAYLSASQTISNNTVTKIQFDTELFDTNSNFNTSTYTFTPTVAGYYQVNLNTYIVGTASRAYYLSPRIYKNGSNFRIAANALTLGPGGDWIIPTSYLIYMNGTTDYLEAYIYNYDYTASSTVIVSGSYLYSEFSASLVRAA